MLGYVMLCNVEMSGFKPAARRIFLYINLYSPRNGSNTKNTATQDSKHKSKQNESSDQVHHKKMRHWLKYKTNKQNQNRTGKLSTHNIFIK